MRLHSVELDGFRGFASNQALDLDADAIVVVGANGNGKTSLFDALLWALAGRLPRIVASDDLLVSRFSETGTARVALTLAESDGSLITITRSFDGQQTKVTIETAAGRFRGPEAEGLIIRKLWADAAMATVPSEALATVMTRSVYLQQDLVREFIDSTNDQQRFAAVSELVGAGRVTELQVELEREKVAWSRATNSRMTELQSERSRLAGKKARLEELVSRQSPSGAADEPAIWAEWWKELHALGVTVTPVPMTSPDAAQAIDEAIAQLDAVRRASERQRHVLANLESDLLAVAGQSAVDLDFMEAAVVQAKDRVVQARDAVAAEQARVSEVRRLQAELEDRSAQLRALAGLALQHLGERCPVCDQDYDIEATRHRLVTLMAEAGTSPASSDVLTERLATLSTAEGELSAAESRLAVAAKSHRDRASSREAIDKRLLDLGLTGIDDLDARAKVRAAAAEAIATRERIEAVQGSGEALALALSRAGDQRTIEELRQEINAAEASLALEDADLAHRMCAGDLAQRVIEALRESASQVVAERVSEIEPMLKEMYGRIDVHPAFRVAGFLASSARGRGQLSTIVRDPFSGVECDAPATVLSSSQMNTLAVCAFLSLNLGMANPPLQAAILDDPLQSLDDINLLGLVDLLRRAKDKRQLCVSTHDARFGDLLARKLRPGSEGQRTLVIELDGWSRLGPTITTHEVKADPAAARLVSA